MQLPKCLPILRTLRTLKQLNAWNSCLLLKNPLLKIICHKYTSSRKISNIKQKQKVKNEIITRLQSKEDFEEIAHGIQI